MPGPGEENDQLDDMMGEAAADLTIDNQQQQNNEDAPAGGGMPEGGGGNEEEVVVDPPKPGAEDNTEKPADVIPPAAAAAAAPEPINFEGISGGLIKSVDDVTRISTEFIAMQTELTQLREQVKADPFANDFVKTINQMQMDGKSPEQVKAFIHLQDLGDISKLSPMDAMIEAKVLRDGRDADIARKQIEMKYQLSNDMDPEVRKVIEANMMDDAKSDYEFLQSQKKDLATPVVRTPTDAVQTLSKETILAQVASVKEKVKDQFNTLGEINLNGKVDKDGKPTADAVMFDLPIPNEFKAQIPQLVEDFFVNSGVAVTKENMATALGIVNYELFDKYGVKIIQAACNQYGNVVENRIRDEYEHKGDLKHNTDKNVNNNAETLTDEMLDSYSRGE